MFIKLKKVQEIHWWINVLEIIKSFFIYLLSKNRRDKSSINFIQ